MTHQTVVVPDIGSAEGAEVVELLVAVGDAIELEQSLIVLESDKASMEIPASHAGVVVELKMAVGDQLSEGDAILVLDTSAADGDNADASHQEAWLAGNLLWAVFLHCGASRDILCPSEDRRNQPTQAPAREAVSTRRP